MVKNLAAIIIGIAIIVFAFLCKIQFLKIVGYILAATVIVFGIFWTIGFIKDKKEEKNKKE